MSFARLPTHPVSDSSPTPATTVTLTALAMLAFAANSLLCRLALRDELIDAASFATVRVVSGALILGLLAWPHWRVHGRPRADWGSTVALFGYMAFFSFAYLSLSTGTGALILEGRDSLSRGTNGRSTASLGSRADRPLDRRHGDATQAA